MATSPSSPSASNRHFSNEFVSSVPETSSWQKEMKPAVQLFSGSLNLQPASLNGLIGSNSENATQEARLLTKLTKLNRSTADF